MSKVNEKKCIEEMEKMFKEMYKNLIEENERLRSEVIRLERINSELEKGINMVNSRGAGRKIKYNDEFKKNVIKLYLEGHTMKTIALELGCSIGTVSNILKSNG